MFGHLLHDISWSWTDGSAYNFVSGPLADAGLLTAIVVWWRKHECHVQGCHRMSWHPHPEHGHALCKRHHPDDEVQG